MYIPGLIVNDLLVDERKIVWLHNDLQNVATCFSSEMTQTPIYALNEYRVSLENTDVKWFVNDRPHSF